jgi:hypothetical protein
MAAELGKRGAVISGFDTVHKHEGANQHIRRRSMKINLDYDFCDKSNETGSFDHLIEF